MPSHDEIDSLHEWRNAGFGSAAFLEMCHNGYLQRSYAELSEWPLILGDSECRCNCRARLWFATHQLADNSIGCKALPEPPATRLPKINTKRHNHLQMPGAKLGHRFMQDLIPVEMGFA